MGIISAIYDHLLSFIIDFGRSSKSTECASTSSAALCEEPDDVYLRFGGGALADMFHSRYKQIKSSKSHSVKARISEELSVLKWMQMEDKNKDTLPDSLKYRDRGHMYFPHNNLLPFVKKVDQSVRKSANTDTFRSRGSELIKVCCCKSCVFSGIIITLRLR